MFKLGGDGRCRSVGVERCANGRCCPVCGPAIAAVRAAEVGAATWRWMTSGEDHSAVFVSIAASHRSGDRLEDLHGQLLDARAAVMRSDSGPWRSFRRRLGVVDLAWRVEHNVGPNGFHVGLHLVLLTDRWWSAEDADRAEAWLVLVFRRELAETGFTGRLSAEHGVDVRPVDDPAGLGVYLTKWGIGRELAAEVDKLGRNGVNVPLAAVPSVLADELGRSDPFGRRYQSDRHVRRLVDGWVDFVRVATADSRHWYRGFRSLRKLVPELANAHRPVEVIAVCTAVLPEELQPERFDDQESEEDEGEGELLTVGGDVWEAALMAWWRGHAPYRWLLLRRSLYGGDGPAVPLELAVAWLAEDHGVEVAAGAVAELAGAELVGDETGLVVCFEPRTDRSVS